MLLKSSRKIIVNSLEKMTGKDEEKMKRENMTEELRHPQINQAP
jgi:hypothetical protein